MIRIPKPKAVQYIACGWKSGTTNFEKTGVAKTGEFVNNITEIPKIK
jgi:predicted nucleic-acid-binding Zn-ribbon protein